LSSEEQMNAGTFRDWKLDPVTIAFFESLLSEQVEVQLDLGSGSAMRESADGTGLAYAVRYGISKGLQQAIEHTPRWAQEKSV
jgi:hypothetical protein